MWDIVGHILFSGVYIQLYIRDCLIVVISCNRTQCSVVVLDDDHLVHVPMSLRARASALDLWLELKRSGKEIGRAHV